MSALIAVPVLPAAQDTIQSLGVVKYVPLDVVDALSQQDLATPVQAA